jgi:hypothetical protein
MKSEIFRSQIEIQSNDRKFFYGSSFAGKGNLHQSIEIHLQIDGDQEIQSRHFVPKDEEQLRNFDPQEVDFSPRHY